MSTKQIERNFKERPCGRCGKIRYVFVDETQDEIAFWECMSCGKGSLTVEEVKAMKRYYGFRYYSNRSCTYGSANPTTGRYSIAGDVQVFRTKADLKIWLAGERVAVTKREARSLTLGCSVEEFEDVLESAERDRYGF